VDSCDGIIVAVQPGPGAQSIDWRRIYEGRITISNNRNSPLQLGKGPVAVTLAQSSGTLDTQESCFYSTVKPKSLDQCYYWIVGPKMFVADGAPETPRFNTVQATVEVSKGVQCSSLVYNF